MTTFKNKWLLQVASIPIDQLTLFSIVRLSNPIQPQAFHKITKNKNIIPNIEDKLQSPGFGKIKT
jgi:hypothetical protein